MRLGNKITLDDDGTKISNHITYLVLKYLGCKESIIEINLKKHDYYKKGLELLNNELDNQISMILYKNQTDDYDKDRSYEDAIENDRNNLLIIYFTLKTLTLYFGLAFRLKRLLICIVYFINIGVISAYFSKLLANKVMYENEGTVIFLLSILIMFVTIKSDIIGAILFGKEKAVYLNLRKFVRYKFPKKIANR